MAQRHEALDSLDDFPTPPWAARALCEHVIHYARGSFNSVWEPACNRGFMLRGLDDYFYRVHASDIFDYGIGAPVGDFLFSGEADPMPGWIITNPPFRLAARFVHRSLNIARRGVAMLTRTAFLEGADRYATLFARQRPSIIAQFVERVPMVKGRCDPKASTATAYCWLVWDRAPQSNTTQFVWIPPCRRKLERPGDYEPFQLKEPSQ